MEPYEEYGCVLEIKPYLSLKTAELDTKTGGFLCRVFTVFMVNHGCCLSDTQIGTKVSAVFLLSKGEIMLKEIKEQIKEFGKLIKKYPYIEDLYIGRAVLYTKIKEYEKAVKDYERAHEDYIYDIITVCKRHRLIKEVEEFYTRKINRDKNNIVNYISRARFYISINEDNKALYDCETILKISPENKFILEMKKTLIKKLTTNKKRSKRIKILPILRP